MEINLVVEMVAELVEQLDHLMAGRMVEQKDIYLVLKPVVQLASLLVLKLDKY